MTVQTKNIWGFFGVRGSIVILKILIGYWAALETCFELTVRRTLGLEDWNDIWIRVG
jgi:hypothetical protein